MENENVNEVENSENNEVDENNSETGQAGEISIEKLKEELDHWKKFSRTHEQKARTLQKEKEEWEALKQERETEFFTANEELQKLREESNNRKVNDHISSIFKENGIPEDFRHIIKGSTIEEVDVEIESIKKIVENNINKQQKSVLFYNPLQGVGSEPTGDNKSSLFKDLEKTIKTNGE